MAPKTKKYSPTDRKSLLDAVKQRVAKGNSVRQACRDLKITPVTYYAWLKKASSGGTPAKRAGGSKRAPHANGSPVLKLSSGLPEGQILIALGDADAVRKALELLVQVKA